MADMRFFMGNMVLIIGLALAFGQYGLADMLDEDVDIGPDGDDFDTNRLEFELADDFTVEEGRINTLIYDGGTNDRDENYGYITYNATDLEEFTLDMSNSRLAFLSDTSVYINDVELSGTTDTPTNGRNVYDVDEKMQQYDISGDADEIEIRVAGDDRIVDVGGGLDFEDYENQSSIEEEDYDVEQSAFDQVASTISTSTQALSQMPDVFVAWVEFAGAIPGVAGTFFRMYIAAFLAYIFIRWIWIG